jgi:hypothetical protein
MQTKAEMIAFLTGTDFVMATGRPVLVVEGDETAAELNEACKYMRAYLKS